MTTPAPQTRISAPLVDELKRRLGEEKVSSAKEDLFVYAYDASLQGKSAPDVAVFPTCTEDVVCLVKFAVEHRIPIYPRGAGTGRSGGAVPSHGGIALVMTRMNRILEINEEDLTATAEPGVVLHELKEAVRKIGLLYPPDPASAKACTLGGNVAECAGGLRGMKYGVTRDYVLQLEVVAMDGAVLRLGAGTMKSVT
ncbi:MAG: FAD-binding protein, partial [bacterium]